MNDQIVTFISVGEIGGMQVVPVKTFLAQFPESWQNLIQQGFSFYLDSDNHALQPDEALLRLRMVIS